MRKLFVLCAFTSILFTACEKKTESTPTTENTSLQKIDDSTSQSAVDWDGTYEGVIPCADCEGIKTELTLNQDNTYTLTEEFLDKNLKVENQGNITWTKDGGSISLKMKDDEYKRYKVGENILFQLDSEGNEITGALAQNYQLKKK
ncbi:copper resistance protein NlpE N-terminal domain-containing protein [Empedobacter falsenii]|uniref:copper resistance protein NlpE n=1 Tax=Empedobacter falsenii TaxID=343874 RepID=UPI00257670B9|nr:copper resistance protein NlpE [Empedobacter falsenii]MDM1298200.1 copper resistance protein NlpE N-terminal domain-containing protein [Empedobacter falsenii]MDM1318243.1 copper resistance protein NlpE N-terminal domain-containing protein [Empedobacter falsenii]